MTTWLQRAEAQLENHNIALKIIEGIANLVKDALIKPDSDARVVLAAIGGAIDTLIQGFDGKITREEVEKKIADLVSRRAAMHAAIDAAIDDKFDRGRDG